MEFIKAVKNTLTVGEIPILLRGFGLGGWLLPEGYMWRLFTKCDRPRKMEAMIETLCGEQYAATFWQRYFDHYITEKDIELIAKEGFNSVRLPLNARHLYVNKNQQLMLSMEMISRVDLLIEWCSRYHIYVILDMHAAPGGQTGQNIDDSEKDLPELFMDNSYEEGLIFLWKELAKRYCNNTTVAGYDLLNEPLPNWFSQYNEQVLPLYRNLIRKIREVDKNHMIILEGVHWATDFSIFDTFTKEEAADNLMLQFHKYWSNPDYESMEAYIKCSERLEVPLFLGESGENNCDWYTTIFPLCERLNISWSFWSYKKMECTNSPITFKIPIGWEDLINWIDGTGDLSREKAIVIFDHFLQCIQNPDKNITVFRALKRQTPVRIPSEAYDEYHICSKKVKGAELRSAEPVSILFENGKIGKVDYKRYGGEEQPIEENIVVQLLSEDSVGYQFYSEQEEVKFAIVAEGEGRLRVSVNSVDEIIEVKGKGEYITSLKCFPKAKQYLYLSCIQGVIRLDVINLS